MKRVLSLTLVIGVVLTLAMVAQASCMKVWLEIWDSSNALTGYDSATTYLKATTCDDGIHNSLCVKTIVTNSDGTTSRKTSSTYTNKTGTINSGEAKASDRSAKKATAYAKTKCYICGSNHGSGTSFVYVDSKSFSK